MYAILQMAGLLVEFLYQNQDLAEEMASIVLNKNTIPGDKSVITSANLERSKSYYAGAARDCQLVI